MEKGAIENTKNASGIVATDIMNAEREWVSGRHYLKRKGSLLGRIL